MSKYYIPRHILGLNTSRNHNLERNSQRFVTEHVIVQIR